MLHEIKNLLATGDFLMLKTIQGNCGCLFVQFNLFNKV